jgi:hypothetical protein
VTFPQRNKFIIGRLRIARHSPRSLNLFANESRADEREKLHDETGEQAGGPSSPFFLCFPVFPSKEVHPEGADADGTTRERAIRLIKGDAS